jgi:hypothetical protein
MLAISAASLAYELAVTRLLSLQQFHHFAFLVVSLAVLASAAGGVLRALLPPRSSAQPLALSTSVSLLGTFAMQIVVRFPSAGSVACLKVHPFPLSLYAGAIHAPARLLGRSGFPTPACLWVAGRFAAVLTIPAFHAPRRSRRRVPLALPAEEEARD